MAIRTRAPVRSEIVEFAVTEVLPTVVERIVSRRIVVTDIASAVKTERIALQLATEVTRSHRIFVRQAARRRSNRVVGGTAGAGGEGYRTKNAGEKRRR